MSFPPRSQPETILAQFGDGEHTSLVVSPEVNAVSVPKFLHKPIMPSAA